MGDMAATPPHDAGALMARHVLESRRPCATLADYVVMTQPAPQRRGPELWGALVAAGALAAAACGWPGAGGGRPHGW